MFAGLPYFKFLKKEGKEKGNDVGQADFARMQREALENYLLDLIRSVVRFNGLRDLKSLHSIRCSIQPRIVLPVSLRSVHYQYRSLSQAEPSSKLGSYI